MTLTPPDSRPLRPAGASRWTNRKAHAFLEALAQHGKVAAAARAVGMTRQSAYRLGRRVPVVAELGESAGNRAGVAPGAQTDARLASPQGDTSVRPDDGAGGAR
jgi:hypothetical protein